MKAKLKYTLLVQGVYYPKNTWVDVLGISDIRVKKLFPNVKYNSESNQVALMLPGRDTPIIHTFSSIEFGE